MELILKGVIFCDAVVPMPDNKITCYGVFSDIYAPGFPITYPHFCVLTSWTGGVGFHIQQLKLLNPSKSLIVCQSPEQYFTLNNETETAYVNTDVNQIIFSEPGAYHIQIYADQKKYGEFPVYFWNRDKLPEN